MSERKVIDFSAGAKRTPATQRDRETALVAASRETSRSHLFCFILILRLGDCNFIANFWLLSFFTLFLPKVDPVIGLADSARVWCGDLGLNRSNYFVISRSTVLAATFDY